MKKIIVLVPGYLPGFKSGGPVRTVANMIEALGDEILFNVVCLDRDLGDNQPYFSVDRNAWNQQGKARVFYVERGPLGVIKLISILRAHDFDAIHLNGFLSFQFSILPVVLLKIFQKKITIIIGPRGEFSLGALALKSKKKKLFIYFVKKIRLYNKVIWHASSAYEADDIRRVMGSSSKIRIANDIALSTSDIDIPRRDTNQPLKIVFVSRISPMKNLECAIRVLSRLTESMIFDVYGPLEDETYWETCLRAARGLPANIKFNYFGSLQPEAVSKTLSCYDLFFLPTRGENFGHVIAEALFAGLPILISDQTPWRQLYDKGVGWDIPLADSNSFESAIRVCLACSSDEYHAWRVSIRSWARKNIGNHEAIDATRQLFATK